MFPSLLTLPLVSSLFTLLPCRLRVDANNSTVQYRDPRFSSISGQLNDDKFLQAYGFLDKQQEQEVVGLQRALKKTKSATRKEALKEQLVA